jgi:hypothetical protein
VNLGHRSNERVHVRQFPGNACLHGEQILQSVRSQILTTQTSSVRYGAVQSSGPTQRTGKGASGCSTHSAPSLTTRERPMSVSLSRRGPFDPATTKQFRAATEQAAKSVSTSEESSQHGRPTIAVQDIVAFQMIQTGSQVAAQTHSVERRNMGLFQQCLQFTSMNKLGDGAQWVEAHTVKRHYRTMGSHLGHQGRLLQHLASLFFHFGGVCCSVNEFFNDTIVIAVETGKHDAKTSN